MLFYLFPFILSDLHALAGKNMFYMPPFKKSIADFVMIFCS